MWVDINSLFFSQKAGSWGRRWIFLTLWVELPHHTGLHWRLMILHYSALDPDRYRPWVSWPHPKNQQASWPRSIPLDMHSNHIQPQNCEKRNVSFTSKHWERREDVGGCRCCSVLDGCEPAALNSLNASHTGCGRESSWVIVLIFLKCHETVHLLHIPT